MYCIKRPLMVLCLLYLLVLSAFFITAGHPVLFAAVMIPIILLPVICLFRRHVFGCGRAFWILVLAVMAFAGYAVQSTAAIYRLYDAAAGTHTSVRITGTVGELSYATDAGAQMTVILETWNGTPLHCGTNPIRLRVISRGDTLFYGAENERIACSVCLTPRAEIGGLTDTQGMRVRRFSENLIGEGMISGDRPSENLGRTWTLTGLCRNIEKSCYGKLQACLPEEHAALIRGILFGNTSDLPPEIRSAFRKLGISHMLAVSGLHLSILLGGMELLLNRTGLHRKLRLLLICLFLLLFMGTAGFSPSVVRAGLMWMSYCLAFFMGGRRDSLTALFFAALCICIVTPTAIFDVGFVLSVSATLGILLMGNGTGRFLKTHLHTDTVFGRTAFLLLMDVSVTISATIFTLPVTLFVFGETSLMAPVANLCLHPFFVGLLLLTPLFLLFSFLPGLGGIASAAALLLRGFGSVTLSAVRLLSHIRGILIGVRYPFLLPVFLFFVLLSAWLLWKYRRILWLYVSYAGCILLFAVCMAIYGTMTADDIHLTYQVQGKNDILAVTAGEYSVLIDCSGGSKTAAKHGWMLLSAQNHTELDLFLLTHYHKKHAVMLPYLMRQTEIRCIALPAPETEEERNCYETICDLPCLEKQETEIITYTRGCDTISAGPARIRTLPYAALERSVQPLLGFLLTGDENETLSPLFYGSSALWDENCPASCAALRDQMTEEADYLLCGIHGPRIRPGTQFPEKTFSALIFGDPAAESFSGAGAECTVSMEEAKSVRLTVSESSG